MVGGDDVARVIALGLETGPHLGLRGQEGLQPGHIGTAAGGCRDLGDCRIAEVDRDDLQRAGAGPAVECARL